MSEQTTALDRFTAFINTPAQGHIEDPASVFGDRFTFGEWFDMEFPEYLGNDSIFIRGQDVLALALQSEDPVVELKQLASDFADAAKAMRQLLGHYDATQGDA